MRKVHFRFMREAVKEARKGLREGGAGFPKDLIESECRPSLYFLFLNGDLDCHD